MKKLLFAWFITNCFALFEARSQNFSHIYQTPLLLNPSFAGSTGGARLAAAANYTKGYTYNIQDNYISFDHLLKKSGIGLGAAFFTSTRKLDYSGVLGGTFSSASPDNFSAHIVGGSVSIAPKYVLNRRNGSKRATLSPSIAISYSQSDYKNDFRDYPMINGYNYDPLKYPYILQPNKEIKLSAGLLYNSDKLITGLVISNKFFESTYNYYQLYTDSSSKVYNQTVNSDNELVTDSSSYFFRQYEIGQPRGKYSKSIQTLDFHISKIFQLGSSRFSITPTLNLGLVYSEYRIAHDAKLQINRINAFLQVSYDKLFLGGGCVNRTSPNNPYFGFIGYKNERIKIMGSYNFWSPKMSYYKPPKTFELSVNYTFKSGKR